METVDALERTYEIKAKLAASLQNAIIEIERITGLEVRGVSIKYDHIDQVGGNRRIVVHDVRFDLSV